jgi:hypothetical protein
MTQATTLATYILDMSGSNLGRGSEPAFWDVDYLTTFSVATLYGVEWVGDR